MKTVILDFVNVVADLNFKNMLSELTLKEKFAALRLFLAAQKNGAVKLHLRDYQKGNINKSQLINDISILYPNAAKSIPSVLNALHNNLIVNLEIIRLVEEIRDRGCQVLLMSNSIPETEEIMHR